MFSWGRFTATAMEHKACDTGRDHVVEKELLFLFDVKPLDLSSPVFSILESLRRLSTKAALLNTSWCMALDLLLLPQFIGNAGNGVDILYTGHCI